MKIVTNGKLSRMVTNFPNKNHKKDMDNSEENRPYHGFRRHFDE